MTDPTPPEALSSELIAAIDSLDAAGLRAVRWYADRRLADRSPSIADEVRAAADGEVLDVQDRGAYTLVRKRSPNRTGDDRAVTLYHVSRERRPNGETALHWSFLGDVVDADRRGDGGA